MNRFCGAEKHGLPVGGPCFLVEIGGHNFFTKNLIPDYLSFLLYDMLTTAQSLTDTGEIGENISLLTASIRKRSALNKLK